MNRQGCGEQQLFCKEMDGDVDAQRAASSRVNLSEQLRVLSGAKLFDFSFLQLNEAALEQLSKSKAATNPKSKDAINSMINECNKSMYIQL